MSDRMSWEAKRRLIERAHAERTRLIQDAFAAAFATLWRSARNLFVGLVPHGDVASGEPLRRRGRLGRS